MPRFWGVLWRGCFISTLSESIWKRERERGKAEPNYAPGGEIMGESLWMCYFGVLVIAFKVNLSRAIVLDSIYWNTTNTK